MVRVVYVTGYNDVIMHIKHCISRVGVYVSLRSSVQKYEVQKEDYYHNNHNLPVYSQQQSRFDTHDIIAILLDPDICDEQVCKTQSVNIEHLW